MFRSIGWPELILILAIVLIIFGVSRLPQVGGAIGKAIKNLRDAQKGDAPDDNKENLAKSDVKDIKQ